MNTISESIQNSPTEIVIKKIKEMLHSGELQPGMKLPAERKLAEEFCVGRTHVRNALQKLEFYGIVKTFPQSGSIVAHLKIQALEGLITDVLKIDRYDFRSLVETRVLLEVQAIRLSAINRSQHDIEAMEAALTDYMEHSDDKLKVEKDFIFHRKIVQGSHNPVLASMLLIITPDILRYYNQHHACREHNEDVVVEHQQMINYIRLQQPDKAEEVMRRHLSNIMEFSRVNNEANHYLE